MTLKGFCSKTLFALGLISTSAFADTVHIAGNAHFELRHTLVSLIIGPGTPVPHSQPFWALVVSTVDGKDYEASERFNLGSEEVPSDIDLHGLSIPNNSHVSLDGTIAYASSHYYWLSAISHVTLMDEQVALASTASETANPFVNWTCEGQIDANSAVYADVWFQQTSGSAGSYVVRLSKETSQGNSQRFSELAYLESAHITTSDGQTTFNASGAQGSFTLGIDNSDVSEQVPGVMTFSIHETSNGAGDGSVENVTQLNVVCDHNH